MNNLYAGLINTTAASTSSQAGTPYPVKCSTCGEAWPCEACDSVAGHRPALIPGGAVVTTYEDLDLLICWAPGGNFPVVLDRINTPWILFATEDGDEYAATVECPDNNTPARYDLDQLPAERGPLRVLFNGDPADPTDPRAQQ